MKNPEILYEDEAIIVCVKPDGMPAQSDRCMSQDMVSFLKTHLVEQGVKGEPYIAIVHRLDRPVGGVMVFAKTKEAAADLSRQVQEKSMAKYYQAVLNGRLPDFEGTFDDYLIKDSKTNLSRVCEEGTEGAKEAVLHYEVLFNLAADKEIYTYALIELETGRHHQIRCQMAHHKVPIYGDTKYNPKYQKDTRKQAANSKQAGKGKPANKTNKEKAPGQIALIATRLEFKHPVTKEHMVFKTEPWGKAFEILDAEEF